MQGGLFEFNFARHAAWWVSGGAIVLIALFVLLDLFDRVRWWVADLRRGDGPDRPGERGEEGEAPFQVRERRGPLRRRFHREVVPHHHAWTERRPNEPAEREERRSRRNR